MLSRLGASIVERNKRITSISDGPTRPMLAESPLFIFKHTCTH